MTVLCDNCSPRKGCTAEKNRTECRFYQPQTNEEWFCQLPTGEKAEFFANIYPKSVAEWCETIKVSAFTVYWWVREKGKEYAERRLSEIA